MKALIIFALIVLISCDDDADIVEDYTIKCPDDKKIKIGEDVCAILQYASKSGDDDVIYVKKKSCGKNKGCAPKDENYNKDSKLKDQILTCQKKLRLLKIGKKCNYNAECYTGFCSGGKCAAYGTEECDDDNNCGPDRYCDNENGGTGKCVAFVNEGDDCSKTKCAPGLECDSTSKCKKLFSLDTGAATTKEEFCKTLAAYNGKCIEVVKVADDCSLTYKDKDGGSEITVKVANDKDNLAKYEDDGTTLKECRYAYRPKDLLDDIIERYNKIKLNKLTEKKKEMCDYSAELLCDKKYAELYYVYYYYDLLLKQQLIKENGEKNKDKKCEYEFWRSTISSSYVNVCYGFALALLGLLF